MTAFWYNFYLQYQISYKNKAGMSCKLNDNKSFFYWIAFSCPFLSQPIFIHHPLSFKLCNLYKYDLLKTLLN